ncbi:hypothetical protein [Lusitaniella coriacea]|uniref:hypothetical protein n=1 Tax=Lusitaniella coriacea TaxID=1983105 RepID=UPI003CE95395
MITEIKEQIQQAISKNDPKQLRECFYALKSLVREGASFSQGDFKFFIGLLKQKNFLKLGGGWYFVMLFTLDKDNVFFHQSEEIAVAINIAEDTLEEFLPEFITEAIEAAIHSGQERQMEECADAILDATLRFSYFPDLYFNLILELLKKESFLKANGSSHFLLILNAGNWYTISEKQKDELLPLLENSYGLFFDWMSCFMITELLGKRFTNEAALNTLCRLKNTKAETARALVPHGFQHFVTDSDDKKLVKKAYEELLQMKEDPSEKVRDEVNDFLRIIANREKRAV